MVIMSRMENKSISVAPKYEQETIEIHNRFGWLLVSTQVIYNQDSHIERRGDSLYNVTETENYVKLMFTRDKDMPNYNEIVSVEQKYYSLLNQKPYEDTASETAKKLCIIVSIISVLFAVLVLSHSDIVTGLFFIAIAALFIFLTVVAAKKTAKKHSDYQDELNKWDKKCDSVLASAENYV